MTPTAARTLAEWGLSVRRTDLPDRVAHAAARSLLDGVGCAIAGSRRRAATAAVEVALGLGGPPESTVLGTGRRTSAPAAALANGTLVHALDFDDTHAEALVHATAAALPAAVAVAEEHDRTGADLLVALVVGHEVACRLGALVPHGFHGRGLHATSVCGVIASALVASRLAGLDAGTTVAALGIAGSQAGGLLEFLATGSPTKQLHPGLAGHAGTLATRLAAAGATGPESVLEGEHGLYAALLGARPDPRPLVAGLGERWATTELTVKPYPACQLLHPALDAMQEVLAAHPGLRPADVTAVECDLHPDAVPIVGAVSAHKAEPRTAYEAKFSLPWSVAALLTDGTVGIDTYAPAAIARPDVARLAARVTTRPAPGPAPAAASPGRVEVRLTDGRTLIGQVPVSTGGPGRPLTEDRLLAKFTDCCRGAEGAAALAHRLLDPDREPSVRALVDAVDAVATPGED